MNLQKILTEDKNYIQEEINDIVSYISTECGYITNSLLKIGSEQIKEVEAILPELIKDLKYEDPDTGLIWYPMVLNVPTMGMIFPDGTNVTNWKWRAVPIIVISEDEQKNYPVKGEIDKYHTHRADMQNSKLFEDFEFKSACKYIGINEITENVS